MSFYDVIEHHHQLLFYIQWRSQVIFDRGLGKARVYPSHGEILCIIIIIIIMIYCPKWKIRNGKSFLEILFAQLIVGPAATEQRQVDVALSLSNVERQTG